MALKHVPAFLALAVVAGAAQQPGDFPPTAGWHADLPSGFAEAKKTGRPLMVVFR